MTTGAYLLSRSSLPSGTALAHLLAIQGGSGTGRTVFASSFTVSIESINKTAKVVNLEKAPSVAVFKRNDLVTGVTNDNDIFVRKSKETISISVKVRKIDIVAIERSNNIEVVEVKL